MNLDLFTTPQDERERGAREIVHALVDQMAEDALEAIREAVAEAKKSINYSVGQSRRRAVERIERAYREML